jgi:DNA helicase HerA-like ATPase
LLDAKGSPTVVERAFIAPPRSQIGPVSPEQRAATIQSSLVYGQYEKAVDRESAFEKLQSRAGGVTPGAGSNAGGGILDTIGGMLGGGTAGKGRSREGVVEAAMKSAARSMASEAGRRIMRGVLGSLFGGRR